MWNCPKCRSEVDAGFEVCWSCGTAQDGREDPTFKQALADDGVTAVVAAPPPPSTAITADDRFVTVASFFSSGRAHVLRCHLEAEGVPVFMGEDSSFSGTLDSKVRVRECDQEKALKILAELPPESVAEDDEQTMVLPAPPPLESPPAVKKRGWFDWLWREPSTPAPQPLIAETPKPVEEPRQVTAWEALRALESELSNLMDKVASKDWKVNPAFHPDVNAFIQKHSNNSAFVQKARGLQQNRAKYYAKIREMELAPKPPPEPEPVAEAVPSEAPSAAWTPSAPASPPASGRLLAGSVRFLRKLAKFTAILFVLLIGLALFGSVGYRQYGKKQLDDAISETNKLDPGWQWASLLANRKDVPDEENAALVVLKVAKLLPEGLGIDETSKDLAKLGYLKPTAPVAEEILKTLRVQQAKAQVAVSQGLAMDRLKTGRYPEAEYAEPAKREAPGHSERFRVYALYWQESMLQAEENDASAALQACRVCANIGRSVGDEPTFSVQGNRIGWVRDACGGMERVLGRTTTASDQSLAQAQHLLVEEMESPLLRTMLRGDRAQWFEWSGQPDAFDDTGDTVYPGLPEFIKPIKRFVFAGAYFQYRAQQLLSRNKDVQLADRPIKELRPGEGGYLALFGMPIGMYQRYQACLRSAVAGLACERYRLAHTRWPESLDQLVPQFLSAVPVDPFAGKPLRLQKNDHGLVVYSIGPDQVDDQGVVGAGNRGQAGTDIGFRLYDVNRRRQAAKP